MKIYCAKDALQSSKGQIKMFETIGVLIVFFMLLSAGGIFYFKMQESALKKDLETSRQLRLLETALKAGSLPELDCSFVGVQKENCFDKLKLDAFAEIDETKKATQYFGLFGHSTVKIRQVYPAGEEKILYDVKLDDFNRKIPAQNPILIYNPISDTYSFGIIEVETYAK